MEYVDVPSGQFAGSLRGAGLDPWLADALDELNQLYRGHVAEAVTAEVRKALGRPPTTLAAWLARHREALLG